jgi:hypothetical protein
MAILLLSVISLYAVALAALYLHNAHIGVGEERYFRYAGILFFLLAGCGKIHFDRERSRIPR